MNFSKKICRILFTALRYVTKILKPAIWKRNASKTYLKELKRALTLVKKC
jgi:hypothetical protein